MARRDLRKLLRGAQKSAVNDAIALYGQPVRIQDTQGRVLFGEPATDGQRHPIQVDGQELGALFGPADADGLARIVTHFAAREIEKRALATETLDRYKELTLLYDMSNQLSKMLDLDDVAMHVVHQADRHLKADAAALFLCHPGTEALQVQASLGHEGQVTAGEVVQRVFSSGRSELVTHQGQLVLCAPLRHGEQVFGVLRATRDERSEEWTAGDLKLVTGVASNAASALRKAQLHARQVRDLALRHQVQRHVSPELLEAVAEGTSLDGARVAVLFCDLRSVSSIDGTAAAAELVEGVEAAIAQALLLLLRRRAVVDLPLGEMLLAVFHDAGDFDQAAQRAVDAALELASVLSARAPVGVGVASGELPPTRTTEALHAIVHVAAQLHEEALGGVLVDDGVHDATGDAFLCTPWARGDGSRSVFEVNAP